MNEDKVKEPFEDEAQAVAGDPVVLQEEAEQEARELEEERGEDSEEVTQAERIKALEEQGEFAADYLEELLDIVDLGGDLDLDVENDRAMVAIVAEGEERAELKRLVGRDGQVLEALQELTRLAVQRQTNERSRLMLDIADFRADLKRELTAIAEEAITKVKATGEPQRLQPMNPFERKVCHDVAAAAGCYSESEGTSPNRFVVIHPEEDE